MKLIVLGSGHLTQRGYHLLRILGSPILRWAFRKDTELWLRKPKRAEISQREAGRSSGKKERKGSFVLLLNYTLWKFDPGEGRFSQTYPKPPLIRGNPIDVECCSFH